MVEEKTNIVSDNQMVSQSTNANQNNDANAYYEALKKIEKEKSKKKRIGCLIVLLIPIVLLAINVIPQLIKAEAPPSEKMNLCEMGRAYSLNRVKAEEKYVEDKDGVSYRYKFVAKVVGTPDEYVNIAILCPECYEDSPQYHQMRIFVGKDFAKELYPGSWIKVDNATVSSVSYFQIATDALTKIEKISYDEAIEFIKSK